MTKRVTLTQVAELAGYSVPTVSMVLTGRKGTRISKQAATKIRAAAKQLGYSPDPTARSLRTGKTAAIGFVSDQVTVTRFASALITGAANRAQEADHVVLISECGSSLQERDQAIRALLERRVDALVLGLMQAREVEVPENLRTVPLVVVNGAAQGLPRVLPDEYAAGQRVANYLLERGHRSIGLIGRHPSQSDPSWSVTIPRRFQGIDDALASAGLALAAEYSVQDWEPVGGERGTREVLSANSEVTAIICANDRLAFGAYRAASELGLRIPEDLSVISFDDEQLASYLQPGLTTMRLPYQAMGRSAADLALRSINEPGETLIEMPMVERDSVRYLS